MGAALEQLHVLCIPSPGRRIVGLGGRFVSPDQHSVTVLSGP